MAEASRTASAPMASVLDEAELWGGLQRPNASLLRFHLEREGRVSEAATIRLLRDATKIFAAEPTLLNVASPVTIVGDIHGQFYDLLKLTTEGVGGDPTVTSYLFLGDYVDRGSFSIECLLYLYALKIARPTKIWLLRGNHECRHLTTHFSFKTEVTAKYGRESRVYEAALASFNALPLAALVERRFLAVHGGISPSIHRLKDIASLERNREPPSQGAFCDLLWADPMPNYGQEAVGDPFCHNRARGCSFSFSFAAVCDFLNRNNLAGIIRAHEAQAEGYNMGRKTPQMFPSLITIFSAPNYLDVYGNKAAVLKYDQGSLNIRQFNASPHPYWLPHFMDVFSWSLPFIADKCTAMMEAVLRICADEELERDEDDSFEGGLSADRKRVIRSKIQSIGRVHGLFSTIRKEEETVLALKGISPNGLLPKGIFFPPSEVDGFKEAAERVLTKGSRHRRLNEVSFEDARTLDSPNERRPPYPPPTTRPHIPPPPNFDL